MRAVGGERRVRSRADDEIGRRADVIKVDVPHGTDARQSAGRRGRARDDLAVGEIPPVGRPHVTVEERVDARQANGRSIRAKEKEGGPALSRHEALGRDQRAVWRPAPAGVAAGAAVFGDRPPAGAVRRARPEIEAAAAVEDAPCGEPARRAPGRRGRRRQNAGRGRRGTPDDEQKGPHDGSHTHVHFRSVPSAGSPSLTHGAGPRTLPRNIRRRRVGKAKGGPARTERANQGGRACRSVGRPQPQSSPSLR